MNLRLLRNGSKGADVQMVEEFLRDSEHYWVEVDGEFDMALAESVSVFQAEHKLTPDGIIGPQTWAKLIERGLDIIEDDRDDKVSANWPPRPTDLSPTNYQTREQKFGHIAFKHAPVPGSPENVIITNDWAEKHIVEVSVPQLAKIPGIVHEGKRVGAGPRGKVFLHEKAAQPMIDLWQRWENEGLLEHVLTWAGLWVTRFVRGSRSVLSNHAYGTAFDINAPWNGLRRRPALVGQKGCVRELVPIANELGWFWGGHFSRTDGMHFEYVGG